MIGGGAWHQGFEVKDSGGARANMESKVSSEARDGEVAPCRHVGMNEFFNTSDDLEVQGNGTDEDALLGVEGEARGPFADLEGGVQGAQLLKAGERGAQVVRTGPQDGRGAAVQMMRLVEAFQHEANGGADGEDKHGPRERAALDDATDEAQERDRALGADGESKAK